MLPAPVNSLSIAIRIVKIKTNDSICHSVRRSLTSKLTK